MLAPEHREQALLALAQDYLRAGLLDRAEGLFKQVSEVPRLRAGALDALRGVYERQHEWQQALDVYGQLARIEAAPPRLVSAHYLCELAGSAIERGDIAVARDRLRAARARVSPFPRAAVLRAQIAERDGDWPLAIRLLRSALDEAPKLMHEELPHLLRLAGPGRSDAVLGELAARAEARGPDELKRLVFAAICGGTGGRAAVARTDREGVRAGRDAQAVWRSGVAASSTQRSTQRCFDPARSRLPAMPDELRTRSAHCSRTPRNIAATNAASPARSLYWHCPACHAWDSLEPYAIVKLG